MPALKPSLCSGLTEENVKILKSHNITTVENLLCIDSEELTAKCEIPYKEVVGIKKILLAQYSAFPVTGKELYEDALKVTSILPTGIRGIDQLLEGGFYSCEVTELFGGAGVGKTQICLRCCVTVPMETGQNVIYMDTGGSFCCHWLQNYLQQLDTNEEIIRDTCRRVRCVQIFDIFELLKCLNELKTKLNEQTDPFLNGVKLLIIDCVTAVISPHLGGKQTDGHGLMMNLARLMKTLAVENSLAVVVTNNAVQSESANSRPSLGSSWLSVPNVRVEIVTNKRIGVKTGAVSRQCVIRKSLRQKCGSSRQLDLSYV
ncbi:DNA repair protein RAD51 homolog 4-like [Tubulanus polymorphus]|uniref:DNA repair protein RAD51 homolog 4-like n=1 Tax=Tubulanus polymorphus TaxID=672921 RepID=UPI003DA308CF